MHTLFAWYLLIVVSPAMAETCLPLDFDSYFVAQNAKNSLKKSNQLGQPNFSTHYLLLKNEMMMESIYLIADCRTGKFIHEKLAGKNAIFSLQSAEITLHTDKSETLEKFLWNGEGFMKVESAIHSEKKSDPEVDVQDLPKGAALVSPVVVPVVSAAASPTPLPSGPSRSSLTDAYQALFQRYPTTRVSTTVCHPLVFDSHFLAQQNKKNIEKRSANFTHPNFAGNWILIKVESLFDTESLVAACETGKFIHATLKGTPVYQTNSSLIRLEQSGKFPALYIFHDDEFVQIPDPVQNRNQEISNILSVTDSAVLYHSLPNPEHRSVVRFEKLQKTKANQLVFEHLQVDTIFSGSCSTERGSPRCTVLTGL